MLTSSSRLGFHNKGSATEHFMCFSVQSDSQRFAISRLCCESVLADVLSRNLAPWCSASHCTVSVCFRNRSRANLHSGLTKIKSTERTCTSPVSDLAEWTEDGPFCFWTELVELTDF